MTPLKEKNPFLVHQAHVLMSKAVTATSQLPAEHRFLCKTSWWHGDITHHREPTLQPTHIPSTHTRDHPATAAREKSDLMPSSLGTWGQVKFNRGSATSSLM